MECTKLKKIIKLIDYVVAVLMSVFKVPQLIVIIVQKKKGFSVSLSCRFILFHLQGSFTFIFEGCTL